MKPAKIVSGNPDLPGGGFATTTENTGLSQRETLEQTLCNLAAVLGAEEVHRIANSRGSIFYSVRGKGVSTMYQSASNLALELSRLLVARAT